MRARTVVLVVVAVLVAAALAVALNGSSTRTASSPTTSRLPVTAPPTTPTPVTPPGYLSGRGTQIVDSSGTVVQLTGYNVTGMESTNPEGSDVPGICNNGWRLLTSDEVAQIARYGFNSVRLPVAWGNLEPSPPTVGPSGSLEHHWNMPYLAALDEEISQLGAAHLRVILDMHQSNWSAAFTAPATAKKPGCPGSGMPVWLNPAAASETPQTASCDFYAGQTQPGVPGTAWADFAAAETFLDGHYDGDPTVVAQDIVNEPNCGRASADLTGFYAYVVPLVHRSNPNLLLMLEDEDDPGSFRVTQMPPVANLVLSVHLHEDYWTAPSSLQSPLPISGQDALTADLQRATQWKVPLYVGEFYAFDATQNQSGDHQPDQNWVDDTASFLSFAKQNDISWSYWAWIQKSDPEVQPEVTAAVQAALQHG
ncbi:MAG: glycoside hydrolase family 5 protein [Acidimicrobiales bacterium]